MEDYWLRYGFTEFGELVCSRVLTKIKPASMFFYEHNGRHKQVQDVKVLKLTKDIAQKIQEGL